MEDLFRQYGQRILKEVPLCFVDIAADRSPIRADSVRTAAIRRTSRMPRSQIHADRDIKTDTRLIAQTAPADIRPADTALRLLWGQAPDGPLPAPPGVPG